MAEQTLVVDLSKLAGTPISVGPNAVQDFQQLLAEAVIVLANALSIQHQPGFQALIEAAYHRQQALNAGCRAG